ncbi:MAG: helix-turn-helix transcriptional regulator [Bacteroidales bacterium]|nr:helix-turn-helix transcriptional regulator [Bacteroidales bacterium]
MKIKHEDFILPQKISREDIDYKEADILVKQIRDLSKLTGKCFTIFDYYKNEFLFISDNSPFFINAKSYEKKGYQFLIEHSYMEDIFLMQQIQNRAYAFLLKQEINQRTNFIFSLNVRMLGEKNKIDTLYRVKPQLLDKKGKVWLSLATIEHTTKFIKPEVYNIETGEINLFKPLKITEFKTYNENLTNQELLILSLMANADSQPIICKHLNIKEPTYKRHRAEIYRKLGVNSKISAINKAYIYGLIN